jgi:hypothetical protein
MCWSSVAGIATRGLQEQERKKKKTYRADATRREEKQILRLQDRVQKYATAFQIPRIGNEMEENQNFQSPTMILSDAGE